MGSWAAVLMTEDDITIRFEGKLAQMMYDTTEVVVPVQSIQRVQIKKGRLGGELLIDTGRDPKHGTLFRQSDPLEISFNPDQASQFEALHKAIQERISRRDHIAPAQPTPIGSELRELASLLEEGAITEEEFSAAKQKLLGRDGLDTEGQRQREEESPIEPAQPPLPDPLAAADALGYGDVVRRFVGVLESHGHEVDSAPRYTPRIVPDGAVFGGETIYEEPMRTCSWTSEVGKHILFVLVVEAEPKKRLRLGGAQHGLRKHFGLTKAEVFSFFPKTKGRGAPVVTPDEALKQIDAINAFLDEMKRRNST